LPDPPGGSAVTNLTGFTVTFTEPVAGLNGNDLLVNGTPAKHVSGSNGVYRFAFAQPNASQIDVTWRTNHGIRDLADLPNAFDATAPGAAWSYRTVDNVPPALAHVAPGPFVAVRSLPAIQITFDEPVTGVTAEGLLVNGLPARQVAGAGAGPYTFVLPPVSTGMVQVAFAATHGIQDAASPANPFAGRAWTYVLDPSLESDFAVEHVVHVSVDGAAGWCLQDYLDNAPEWFTNLVRLRDGGAGTLNARCDYEVSVTLPNHASMFTGRPVKQPKGWTNTRHHGLTIDSDNGTTLHDPRTGNTNVGYQASVFDVAHDHGLSTAFLCGKQSMMIFVRSWDGGHGAADVTGPDNGSNKIDFAFTTANETSYGPSAPVVDQFVRAVATNGLWHYTFIHLEDADATGHARRWGSAGYSNGVLIADRQIGRVLDAIQSSPAYLNRTAVIVTADHGGGAPPTGHNFATNLLNCRIPFFIWGPGIPAGAEAHRLFSNREDPGNDRVSYADASRPHPLRNGDSGNLALSLLGLPPIPGSSLIPRLNLMPVPIDVSPRANGR
jgi:hypothetical protein